MFLFAPFVRSTLYPMLLEMACQLRIINRHLGGFMDNNERIIFNEVILLALSMIRTNEDDDHATRHCVQCHVWLRFSDTCHEIQNWSTKVMKSSVLV